MHKIINKDDRDEKRRKILSDLTFPYNEWRDY